MQIQINAPKEPITPEFSETIESSIRSTLKVYESRLTRVEVHLRDLNAHKGGVDKRCVLEARPRGLDPMAAEHESTSFSEAFRGALEKLHRVLERRFGRLASRGQGGQ